MKTRFLKDVKEHKMTILKDDGVYRHIHYAKPSTGNMHFDIVTYPGYLVISGDMGDYIFSRLTDMFEFFETVDDKLNINYRYWTEKLKSISKFGSHNGSIEEYCPIRTWSSVKDYISDVPKDNRQEFKEEIKNADTTEEAMQVLYRYDVPDAWEAVQTKPLQNILWILYAVKWGILKYKKAKA